MKILYSAVLFLLLAGMASAQYVRKDGTLQDALGRAMSQATVYVCTQPCTSNTIPPSPLATIYSNAAGSPTLLPGQVSTDGLGNFNYYFNSVNAPYTEVFVWHGVIVKVLPDQDTFGSGGSNFSFSCAGALNGSIMATTNPTTGSCDPLMGTDFSGNGFSQSWATVGAFNGFYALIGGGADPGTDPKFALTPNTVRLLAPATTSLPYYARVPSTPCAVGQVWQVTGVTTDGNGDEVDTYGCLTPSSGGGIEMQVGGVDLANTSGGFTPLANLVAGSNCTITNTSGGNVTINCSGSGLVAALNPTAPTVTPGGTPGSTAYSYVVYGCEDQGCTKTSAASAAGSTSTGNATLDTTNYNKLTAYADTLYGYRYYVVCRTAGGATQGIIAQGVGKQFKDTGLAGDSTDCTTVTNTSGLDQHCIGAALPLGVNVIPGAPCGTQAPPSSPAAFDDEFSWGPPGTWTPGGTNSPQWQQLNWGTSTATLTSGQLVLTPQSSAGNAVRMLGTTATLPATPWEFELRFLPHFLNASGTAGGEQAGMCLYDGTKAYEFSTGVVADGSHGLVVYALSDLNTFSSSVQTYGWTVQYPNWQYMKIKDDGTNYFFYWSFDGVSWLTVANPLVGAFLGTPTSIGPCMFAASAGANSNMSIDFFRRTQ